MGSVILSTFVAHSKPSVQTAGLVSQHNTRCSMERLGEAVQDVKVQHLTFYTQIAEKILKISNFFPCFQNFMENLQNLIKIVRMGGNTSDRPGRVGISCFSLLCTAIPSPYVFQTIINLAVTNTSCFLGTDISKQHHCVVLLLHFTRILWLFLVVACPHTFFFLIYFTRIHVSPCDVLLLLYFRR